MKSRKEPRQLETDSERMEVQGAQAGLLTSLSLVPSLYSEKQKASLERCRTQTDNMKHLEYGK